MSARHRGLTSFSPEVAAGTSCRLADVACALLRAPLVLSDVETYLAAPCGRTCAGPSAFCWLPIPSLRVLALWSEPTLATIDFVVQATRSERGECGGRYDKIGRFDSLIDLRGLRNVPSDVLERGVLLGSQLGRAWVGAVRRSVIVHDGRIAGIIAAAVVGYTVELGLDIAVSTHADLGSALERLGVDLDTAELEAGIASRRAAAEGEAPLEERVRAWLADNLRAAAMEPCARALGLAPRTLQRRLAAEGRTFRALLQSERVNRAATLLSESDLKVAAVADEVGYPKMQSLASVFRRTHGASPRTWRRAHR